MSAQIPAIVYARTLYATAIQILMTKTFVRILAIFLLASCARNRDSQSSSLALEDSALTNYLAKTDSAFAESPDFWGNSREDPSYIFLSALKDKDTNYLREVINTPVFKPDAYFKRFRKENIPDLMNLTSESAIQFEYSETFCNQTLVATIEKTGDTVLLRIVKWETQKVNSDSLKYIVVENLKRNLTIGQWEDILEQIELADFWNLRNRNSDCVLDPSHLYVRRVVRSKAHGHILKFKSIQRTVFRRTALYSAFTQLLTYSNTKLPCK